MSTLVVSQLLYPSEVAERLRISRRTLDRYASTGTLPRVVLTRSAVRYRPEDVEAFIDSRRGVSASR